jgi:hypothetical protein
MEFPGFPRRDSEEHDAFQAIKHVVIDRKHTVA